ncbi:MAG: radical SAM protein, partial [archaeon]|nr:radical SAM protein [archaeon]
MAPNIMKSIDIKNMKKIDSKNKKRILLLNPKRKDLPYSLPHNGLALLAAILKKRGHEVLVVDYLFLRSETKNISSFMDSFKPDVIGLTMYAPVFHEANNLIDKIRAIDGKIPIMVGGAFPTLYSNVIDNDLRIDYIFLGEAELTIIGIVESAKRQKIPKIVNIKEIVNLDFLPHPDYTSFYKYKTITSYPMMTSRGCPYRCSFCSSVDLSHRRWRMKSPEACIEEIQLAKKSISSNMVIHIYDDNPNVDKKRFNKFLELFHEKIGGGLNVTHTRADSIDNKFLILLKKCGVRSIMVGVEHGNKEVYDLVNKGETLEQIENACRLIKKHGIGLGLSFVVGLPLDNLERTKESIAFCNKVGAEGATINPIIPYRGTAVRRWFENNNATLYNEIGKV